MKINYNEILDILYIQIKKCNHSYEEEKQGIVLNYDMNTKELVGIDIWNFSHRIGEGGSNNK